MRDTLKKDQYSSGYYNMNLDFVRFIIRGMFVAQCKKYETISDILNSIYAVSSVGNRYWGKPVDVCYSMFFKECRDAGVLESTLGEFDEEYKSLTDEMNEAKLYKSFAEYVEAKGSDSAKEYFKKAGVRL